MGKKATVAPGRRTDKDYVRVRKFLHYALRGVTKLLSTPVLFIKSLYVKGIAGTRNHDLEVYTFAIAFGYEHVIRPHSFLPVL